VERDLLLLPRPRRVDRGGGSLRPGPGRFILLAGDWEPSLVRSGAIVQEAIGRLGVRWEITKAPGENPDRLGALVRLAPGAGKNEAYRLEIGPTRIELHASGPAGIRYGAITLRQIARQADPRAGLPCVRIEDAPDYAHRGVLLDISRDRVPTMETLRRLGDLLEELKLNELQLYTEHTFAYRNHREVWEHASPLTGEQVLELDRLLADRFVELVPNQNSFGHMERWLRHPRYRPLAEIQDPDAWGPPGEAMACRSLCPLDPGSLRLLEELYDELLPHFSSRRFNVGLDETMDVGQGRSRQACEERGAGRVYLDFLLEVYRRVRERGRTMMFWGDMALSHPELLGELPQDAVALDWGYEAGHPFAEEGEKFARAGLRWTVCPGTSSWNSFAGRAANALANIRQAAEAGLGRGAVGFLLTDWGDNGHMQPLAVSFPFYAYGAAVAWGVERNCDLDLARAVDMHVFEDGAGVLGEAALDLANVYRLCGVEVPNRSVVAWILLRPSLSFEEEPFRSLGAAGLASCRRSIEEVGARLIRARPGCPDGDRLVAEYALAARLLTHSCELGMARIEAGRVALEDLPSSRRRSLASELGPLVEDYRRLWLSRSRPGGLSDSAGRLVRLLDRYRGR